MINLTTLVYDLRINSLIKSYFNLYFNHKFLEHKYISRKRKSKSLNKIYVSKAEIKHTNSKAIITIYVYNRERFLLLEKILKFKKIIKKKIGMFFRIVKIEHFFPKLMILWVNKNKFRKFLSLPWIIQSKNLTKDSSILWRLANYKVKGNYNKVDSTFYIRMKRLAVMLYRILSLIRRFRLRLSLNKYKFEEVFLYRLSKLISKYYGKKVEFNIINLKSIAFNGDIFTEILTKKIKKERRNPSIVLNTLLSKVMLPISNRIVEKGRIENNIDLKLIDNKYKNLNVSSILHNNNSFNYNLNKLLYNIYNENTDKLTTLPNEYSMRDIILDNIKYKNIGGVRLRVKGRLTKRYRADRAVFKMKWKGGLKNIDSAFKGLSTVQYLGYQDSNVTKSLSVSKRRIGSFGVKAWFGGKNYSTASIHTTSIPTPSNLNPWAITGFSDAESTFIISVYKDSRRKLGWAIKLCFRINLHVKDINILNKIHAYFNGGFVTSDIDSNKIWIYGRLRFSYNSFW